MKTLWKQALIAAALGTAMSASAQYTNPPSSAPGATPDPSPMTTPATPATPATGAASQQDRVPANRDRDAQKVCASVPAADREACIARENAKNNDKTPMSSGSSTSQKSPGTSNGSSSGTGAGNSTGATGGGTGAPK